MRVLLLEPDPQIRALVRRGLEPEGHEVFALSNADQALAVLRSRPVDLVVCAIEPGGSEGSGFVQQARGVASGTAALFLSAFHGEEDPEIGVAMSAFARSEFLAKPFSPTELATHLRRLLGSNVRVSAPVPLAPRVSPLTTVLPERVPAPRPAAAPPAPPPPASVPAPPVPSRGAVNLRNLQQLARLWASRSTGTICVSGAPGGLEGWASLSGGGPVGEESRRLLAAALGGGDLTFEAAEVTARGDVDGMGTLLWSAAYDADQSRFAQENRFQALTRTAWTNLATHLPISSQTRRLLSLADGQLPLGEAIAREHLSVDQVSADLFALARLRMVVLQVPVAVPRRPEATATGLAGHSGEASLALDRPSQTPSGWGRPGTSSGSGTGRPGQTSSQSGGHGRPAQAPPAGRPASASVTPSAFGPPRVTPSSAPSGSRLPSAGAGASGRSRAPGATHSGSGERAMVPEASHRKQAARALSLQGELNRLQGATPSLVLGLPVDAPAELVREVAARHRARYAEYRGEGWSPEVRKLAEQMLAKVDEAERHFSSERRASAAQLMDEERLLSAAREAIAQRKWEIAGKLLLRARQLRADHPGVLANLGWVLFNDPSRPAATRVEEARELLALAEQFDPNNADGQYYLAEVLYRNRELQAALTRADRAVRARPDNAEAVSLARRVRARLAASD